MEDRGARGEAPPGDPYRSKRQGQVFQGDQQRGWGSQHWQARADQADPGAGLADQAHQRDRRAPEREEQWKAGTSHKDIRYGDWRRGNWPTCRFPKHAYMQFCKMCGDPEENAKWELPRDPRSSTCRCGALVLPRYTGACLICHKPIPHPEGIKAVCDPQGDGPLPAPRLGGDLRGHTAEPIMLWTEAILNPSGPPEVGCAWPPAPLLPHVVAYYPDGSGFKLPYITSGSVAEAWRVDHNTPCAASSWGTDAASGVTRTPRRCSTSGGTGRRRAAPWEWPSCRFGRTCPSPTPDSWRTAA